MIFLNCLVFAANIFSRFIFYFLIILGMIELIMLLQAALVQVLFATLNENAMEASSNVFLSVDLYMLHEV